MSLDSHLVSLQALVDDLSLRGLRGDVVARTWADHLRNDLLGLRLLAITRSDIPEAVA